MKILILLFLLFVTTPVYAASDFVPQDHANSKKLKESCIAKTKDTSGSNIKEYCSCITEQIVTHPELLTLYDNFIEEKGSTDIILDVFRTLESSWWSEYMDKSTSDLTEKGVLILSISMNASFACAEESGILEQNE